MHGDLPVELVRERDPGDGAIVVVGVDAAEGHDAALSRVPVWQQSTVKH